jgi:hypothetical protein
VANTYGPPIVIDGPQPSPPALTLVGAARAVPVTGDRWINGAAIWPYPRDLPDVFDPCQSASSAGHSKDAGTPATEETYASFNVLEGITCTTRSVRDPGEWQRRVTVALEAYEHWAIEREFWSGALRPDNPHLAQAAGTNTLNAGTAVSVRDGVARLEQEIADKGGNGFIHMRPTIYSLVSAWDTVESDLARGVAKTQLGTIVVPGVGYVGSKPDGTAPTNTVEWLYATGPVEVRKSEVQILPDTMSAATDRQHNVTTFRAERYVLITWDQRIHAAVQVDRTITPVT